ncbi:MAG: hypothetical protein KGJ62_14295 [Armatimonadetes bacterium]|nr:hypothetical protein [Armatimonadota bacterium]MDE2207078.1 hypothetical protein [Armatimonadota bacterium]
MKRFLGTGLIALTFGLVLVMSPGICRAQDGESTPELAKNWTLRVGPYFVGSEAASRKIGNVAFSGMVERQVYTGNQYDITVGIGYNGWDTVYSIPVMVNLIAHKDNLRYGGGAGYSFGKRASGTGTDGAAAMLLVGYDLVHGPNPISADLRYYFISGSNSELNGYSLTLGMKF